MSEKYKKIASKVDEFYYLMENSAVNNFCTRLLVNRLNDPVLFVVTRGSTRLL